MMPDTRQQCKFIYCKVFCVLIDIEWIADSVGAGCVKINADRLLTSAIRKPYLQVHLAGPHCQELEQKIIKCTTLMDAAVVRMLAKPVVRKTELPRRSLSSINTLGPLGFQALPSASEGQGSDLMQSSH